MADSNYCYEFNVPQHFIDFKEQISEEPDDSYFDCQDGSGAYQLVTPLPTASSAKPLRSRSNAGNMKRPLDVSATPKTSAIASKTPKREAATPKRPAATPKRQAATPKRQAATPKIQAAKSGTPKSLAAVYKTEPASMEVDDGVEQDSEDKENAPGNAIATPGSSRKGKRSSIKREKSTSPAVGVRCSPRLAAIAKAMRRNNAARRSNGTASRRSSSSDAANLTVINKPKTTNKSIPRVPGMKGLSENDRADLEAIATFKQKITANKKKSELSGRGHMTATVPQGFNFATDSRLRQKNKEEPVIASEVPPPAKSIRHGPTRPKEFHFATDSRIKNHTSNEEEETKAFPESLRSGAAPEKEMPKGPTIPQPFHLSEARSNAGGNDVNKFVSVAELNLKFHTRTPQRFRSKPRGEAEDALDQNKKFKNATGVTIPVTPNLTKTRSRQVDYLTREEMEEKEFEEEQKHSFKANPVNKKVFAAPPEIRQTRKSTIPAPFKITKTKKEEAAPLGNNLKEMCKNLGFSTSSIASLPWGGIPSKWDKTNTKVQPFSFDTRDKTKRQRKQEMIQKVIEDEKKLAEFHAHPMPIFEDGVHGVPEKRPPTPTRAKPFNLRSDQRGEVKKDQFQRSLMEEKLKDKERRTFHARSDAVVHMEPFIPEKSNKALTDISGFALNTEVRAIARSEYELHVKKREDEIAAAKREREERQAAEEEEEVARMRSEAVHKANPVRKFKPVAIKPAANPPTVPISPEFATKSRLRSKNMSMTSSANSTMNMSTATFSME